jgi:hypothetical protein
MLLAEPARKALEYLRASFEKYAERYPNLRHIIVETPSAEAFSEANIAVPMVFQMDNRQVRLGFRHEREIQAFIDDDFSCGKEGYERFWPLTEDTVETLSAWGLMKPDDPAPDPQDVHLYELKKSHYPKQWMLFVHRFARSHPGSIPRSASAYCVEHVPLKKGGVAHTLTPGVFKSSALVLERILSDPGEQVVDIDEQFVELIPDPATLTVGAFRRLLWDVDKLHEKAGMKGREWQGRYPPKINRAIILREHCMNQSAGFKALKTYLNVELGKYVTIEAMDEFTRRVARQLDTAFDGVDQLTIVEALEALAKPGPGPNVVHTLLTKGSGYTIPTGKVGEARGSRDATPSPPAQSHSAPSGAPDNPEHQSEPVEAPDLITLDQAAALVHKTKRALEYHKTKGKLPAPFKEGGGGKPGLYDWKVMGPWLEKEFGIPQPVKYPRLRES